MDIKIDVNPSTHKKSSDPLLRSSVKKFSSGLPLIPTNSHNFQWLKDPGGFLNLFISENKIHDFVELEKLHLMICKLD